MKGETGMGGDLGPLSLKGEGNNYGVLKKNGLKGG